MAGADLTGLPEGMFKYARLYGSQADHSFQRLWQPLKAIWPLWKLLRCFGSKPTLPSRVEIQLV